MRIPLAGRRFLPTSTVSTGGATRQGQPIDDDPATMLDCPTYGGWDRRDRSDALGDSWWQAPYFTGLYQDLYTNKNVTIITRIDYNWG